MSKKIAVVDGVLKLRTEDYEPDRIPAGQISESGIIFRFTGTETLDGKHGEFMRILGENAEGDELAIDTSSSKLMKLFSKNYEILCTQVVLVCGYGKDYTRNYSVEILNDADRKKAGFQ